MLQNSPNSMTAIPGNPQGIVVPASALQQGNISMATVNSQVVTGGRRGAYVRDHVSCAFACLVFF